MGTTKINPNGNCKECGNKLFMLVERKSGYCTTHIKSRGRMPIIFIADDAWTEKWLAAFERRKLIGSLNARGLSYRMCANCSVKLQKWDTGYVYCFECLQIPPMERDGYYATCL